MRPAAVFPLAALILLCVGGVLTIMGRCDHRTQKLVFIGGGASIVSGILTLIGIVLYVGSVSQAFDAITGPITIETKYVYFYGAALRLCIVAFVLSEFSGVFAIYLFLAQRRHQSQAKITCPQITDNKAMFTQNHREYKVRDCLLETVPVGGDSGYFANSISTIGLSPSQLAMTTTSFAQASLTDNVVSAENQSNSNPLAAPYSRTSSQKTLSGLPYSCRRVSDNKSPRINHATGDAIRVKVVPHPASKVSRSELNSTQSVRSLNVISLPSSHSSSSPSSISSSTSHSQQSPISLFPINKSSRKIPLKRRKIAPVNCSTTSLRWVDENGRRPSGTRSAIIISSRANKGDETIQDSQWKKPRPGTETVTRSSCRDCELLQYKQWPVTNRAIPTSTASSSVGRPRLSSTIVLTASEAETSSSSTSRCDRPLESPSMEAEYSFDDKSSSRCGLDRKYCYDQSPAHAFQVSADRGKPKSSHQRRHSSLEVSSSLLTVQKSSDEKPGGGSTSQSSSACSHPEECSAQGAPAPSTSNSEWYLKRFITPTSTVGPSPDSEACQCIVNPPKLLPWGPECKYSACTSSGGTRLPPSLLSHRGSYAPFSFLPSTKVPTETTCHPQGRRAPAADSSKSSAKQAHHQKITPV
nr:unnamed protein product [Spirometra erinaceieuropaei]